MEQKITRVLLCIQIFGEKAASLGLKAKDYASNNDSYSFFEKCDALVMTGPTRTNVNDFRAIYILPEK